MRGQAGSTGGGGNQKLSSAGRKIAGMTKKSSVNTSKLASDMRKAATAAKVKKMVNKASKPYKAG